MIVRARAPLRVELAGGGTDVAPWSVERGSRLVFAGVNKYAEVGVYSRRETKEGDVGVVVDAWDLDVHNHRLVSTKPVNEEEVGEFYKKLRGAPATRFEVVQTVKSEAKLDLLKALMNLIGLTPESKFYAYYHADSPVGTGLGSSGATTVALLGALHAWKKAEDGPSHSCPLEEVVASTGETKHGLEYAIARMAWEAERQVLGLPGGWQDHVASVFGGFNAVEVEAGAPEFPFPHAKTRHASWWPDDVTLAELEACCLLAYVGRRERGGQIEALQGGMKGDSLLKAMVKAGELEAALVKGDLREFGLFVDAAWEAKFTAAPSIVNERIMGVYHQAVSHGGIGGCLCGAGSGGFLFLYCEPQMKRKVMKVLEREKAVVWPFSFQRSGLQVWTVPE